ncbi:MAG: hypothetical protein HC937_03875 [Aquincola sp.]|nr:hypothetical protein [Aquincola sp.]
MPNAVVGWLERMAGRAIARPLLERFVREKAIKLLGRYVCLPAFAPALSAADEKLLAGMVAAATSESSSLGGTILSEPLCINHTIATAGSRDSASFCQILARFGYPDDLPGHLAKRSGLV